MEIAGWEERYRSGRCDQEDPPTPLLVETVESMLPGAAIDLACGAGRNALYLAERGWTVTAVDGSKKAIELVHIRAVERNLHVNAVVADLKDANFVLPTESYDFIVIAFYLQRDLFEKVFTALRPGGVVLAIAHTPDEGEDWSEKRAAPGELRGFFEGWAILHYYEGPSRDPAHHRPVAEIVARRASAPVPAIAPRKMSLHRS